MRFIAQPEEVQIGLGRTSHKRGEVSAFDYNLRIGNTSQIHQPFHEVCSGTPLLFGADDRKDAHGRIPVLAERIGGQHRKIQVTHIP